MGTNLLSRRLKELEEEGLASKKKLPPPASSIVYTLTPRGEELEPVLESLAQWGRPLLGSPRENDRLAKGWLMLAMKKSFRPEAAAGVDEVHEYHVDADVFQVRIQNQQIEIRQGQPWTPGMTLTTDSNALMQVVAGELSAATAVQEGLFNIEGDTDAFWSSFSLYGVAIND